VIAVREHAHVEALAVLERGRAFQQLLELRPRLLEHCAERLRFPFDAADEERVVRRLEPRVHECLGRLLRGERRGEESERDHA